MAFAILNETLELARTPRVDYSYADHHPAASWMRRGPHRSVRVSLYPASRRVYSVPLPIPSSERAALFAFLEARRWTVDAFLFRDPRDVARTDNIGTGDGAALVFDMETDPTGDGYRYYPRGATAVVKVNGSAATATALGWALDVDARRVTFTLPPVLGHSVEIEHTPLRLVRLTTAPTFGSEDPAFETTTLELSELLRD